ncbi:MAG TPA: protein-L-isoaspartate(D-aspartate) O-methyltransferase [Candidatus Nanoarchaeia archaeon]|nr:protein-L-isoaspartate(D-aspartate) O-methyltransferase [Candidatus Nanoarchaeia archaeon]
MESTNWKTLVDNLIKQGKLRSSNVIQAMQSVPRTKFLPPNVKLYTSSDMPLQIGYGQTICAPSMVGIMNEALQPQVGNKILEIGAGSGWHAATLAEIVAPNNAPRSEWGHVYTVEVVQALADIARKNIMNAGFGDRVTIITGDGSKGCIEKAPFDRIIVAAACPNVPKLLVDQLKDCGILLVPVGSGNGMFQTLKKVMKSAEGKVKEENLGGVAFLPLA